MEKRITARHVIILLAVIFLAGVGIRYNMYSKMIETFDAYGAIPFAKESASHYRYARMIAEGKQLPEVDYQAQHPEGHIVADDSILEEYVAGILHRVLPMGAWPLDRFISLFVILFSSLSILAVYHFCRSCLLGKTGSLFAALFYTVSIPSILRNVGTEFAREHFSLPFIFFHASWFLRAVDEQRDRRSRLTAAILSAVSLGLALASWKLCRFYFLIWVVFMVFQFIWRKNYRPLLLPVAVIGGGAFLAGLLVPHLRADLFITSTPMVLLYALGVLVFIELRIKPLRLWVARAAIVALVAAVGQALPQSGRFGHVYYTTLYQLRFLFRHPQNPALLPPEARLYWVPGYTHPTLYNFLAYFTVPLLAGALAVGRSIRDFVGQRLALSRQFLLYALLATLASFLFFSRLHVFFIFFLAACVGWSLEMGLARFRRAYLVYAVAGLLCLHQVAQALGRWDPLRVMQTMNIQPVQEEMFLENVANVQDMVRWTREHTPPESVVLSYWHTSVQILAYADRTTVLHSFFEDSRMRKKIIDFAQALYGDEDMFYAFCQQNGVDYFIYSAKFFLDYTTVGTRFLADRLAVEPASFTTQAHFHPERLRHFGLRYQNDCFRIYELIRDGEEKTDWPVDYQPIFDPLYIVANADQVRRFADEISLASYLYYSGVEAVRQGHIRPALNLLQRSLSIVPSLVDAQILAGRILEGNGMTVEAIAAYRQALLLNSKGPSASKLRGSLERLLISSVSGSFRFDSSNDAGTDSTFSGATLDLKNDGTFMLSNPDFETPDRRSFAVVESGTWGIADSTITFHVQKQEPPAYRYFYLFQLGQNTLLYGVEQGQLVLTGGSASGGLISLRWKRSSS